MYSTLRIGVWLLLIEKQPYVDQSSVCICSSCCIWGLFTVTVVYPMSQTLSPRCAPFFLSFFWEGDLSCNISVPSLPPPGPPNIVPMLCLSYLRVSILMWEQELPWPWASPVLAVVIRKLSLLLNRCSLTLYLSYNRCVCACVCVCVCVYVCAYVYVCVSVLQDGT